MKFGNIVGQTLDGKYRIERELGKGGMGAVFLATHLGTERPVAVKVIVPEFMERPEFIERFRREARAAGRLRHPNVVDVTDFGIAETIYGNVAYLVMEYLDGCTLGEVLDEEKKLPLAWTIDILEQVCSAVQEAHTQGIIHRDLKPDNIWLEPNQRGGYTVKVLDFGIAKLETQDSAEKINLPEDVDDIVRRVSSETVADQSGAAAKKTFIGGENGNATFAGNKDSTAVSDSETIGGDGSNTALFEPKTLIQTDESGTLLFSNEPENEKSEAGTLIQTSETPDGKKTAILESGEAQKNEFAGTKLFSATDLKELKSKNSHAEKTNLQEDSTRELTRVGAVLGTPLYMSPEQCRGEHLTSQSDLYSLAVIAYQMLAGKTPFEGNFTEVMEAHKNVPPPPLNAKNVSRRLKKMVFQGMAKNPEDRPKDAEAFATVLRAQSEGLGTLYREAIAVYGKFLPTFLLISTLVFLPVTLLSIMPFATQLLQYVGMIESTVLTVVGGVSAVLSMFLGFFFGAVGFGTMTLIIARHLAAPLRPLDLKSAFKTVKQKWKTIFGLVSLASTLILLGFSLGACLLGIPGVYLAARFGMVTPVIVMENLKGRAAFRRSNELFKRAPFKIIILTIANFIFPMMLSGLIWIFLFAVLAIIPSDNQFLRGMGAHQTDKAIIAEYEKKKADGTLDEDDTDEDFQIKVTTPNQPGITSETTETKKKSSKEKEQLSEDDKYARRAGDSLRQILHQVIWLPLAILLTSFTQVLMALMYIKTRQAGGEPMRDLLKQFDDEDKPQTRWQERIQRRLIQSGRITGKT